MIAAKAGHSVGRLNESARNLDRIMALRQIPDSERTRFLSWTVNYLWKEYTEERMSKKIIIENEIKNLGIRLPNGTAKKAYQTSFSLPTDKIYDIQLIGAEEIGLSLSVGEGRECMVSGVPAKAGDFNLRLRYSTVEGEAPSELVLPIAFNPDPRSLWKDIPTDPKVPYYKPDAVEEYVEVRAGSDGTPRKDMVAASKRGRSHAQEGKARDDHFNLFHCDTSDWYIMAVADGAGSARYSRKGSQIACETVVDHCRNLLMDNGDFENAIKAYNADRDNAILRNTLTRYVYDIVFKGAVEAHEAVNRYARLDPTLRPKDFATTLMFAICKKYDFGWFIASFWVGDGAMCLYDEKNCTAKLLGVPDEGEFSGQTRFLTMPEIFRDKDVFAKRLRMSIVPDFSALVLMTDGVSDPMFETDRNLNDFGKWKEFFATLKNGFPEDGIGGVDLADDNPEAAGQLLRWLDFWSPGNHDDRTLAILY